MNFILIIFRRRRHRRRHRRRRRLGDYGVYECFVLRTTCDGETLTHLLMSNFIKTLSVNCVNSIGCGDMKMW